MVFAFLTTPRNNIKGKRRKQNRKKILNVFLVGHFNARFAAGYLNAENPTFA